MKKKWFSLLLLIPLVSCNIFESNLSNTASTPDFSSSELSVSSSEKEEYSDLESASASLESNVSSSDGFFPGESVTPTPLTKEIDGETYHLLWSDEFDGTSLNEEIWSYDLGTGPNGDGWGNNELQYYRKENTAVRDGMLIITAKNEIIGGRRYTSSRIKTQNKKYFTYGYIEGRIKSPSFQGSFPAFWLLGNDIDTRPWPYCGEIDIFESVNTEAMTYSTCHWNANGMNTDTAYSHAQYGQSKAISARDENWHTFATLWTRNMIRSYVDDILYYTIDITPATLDCFHNDFFVLFDLAVGSNWAGTSNINLTKEESMYVDYVRVYQK